MALTKLERNFGTTDDVVEHSARSGYLQASILHERYIMEIRPYVIGRVSSHDQTLQMWIEDRSVPCMSRCDEQAGELDWDSTPFVRPPSKRKLEPA